ncbi:single-stranded DNA-binding protein [uncultured Paenibacillus sp.]|uniref:single-stranded DNA-binding protein n=1 Tax=uncultured Paenibacillus sp. TaxID=227322 RepID=UPI0015B3790E|nr:single-stranded DNA-binding protein [uncultured Paenibacillus sp.]
MSIRDQLKQREEDRNTPKGNGLNEGLPEGVTRYVRLGSELKDGRQFVILADPDSWYFYFCHEDGDFATRATYVKKHTCLHSPRGTGADLKSYTKPNGGACISCKAKAKRKLYFMIPVFDLEYKTWRVLDIKEYHAMNLIGDYDKLEKAAKKFNKEYTLVGDVAKVTKTSDGKSYSLESGDADVPAEAAQFIGFDFPYEELANFREEDDILALLNEADPEHVDKSVLSAVTSTAPAKSGAASTPTDADKPVDISDDDLPF